MKKSHFNNYLFFMPQTDEVSRKKTLWLVDRTGQDAVISELRSIKRAEELINRVYTERLSTQIVIDTACQTGRELLRRLKHISQEKNRIWLTQAYYQLKQSPVWKPGILQKRIIDDAISAPRSNGGKRPCLLPHDLLCAELGSQTSKKLTLTAKQAVTLFEHPICCVPRFFIQATTESLGALTKFDAKIVEHTSVMLAANLLKLRQSPFPMFEYGWFSTYPTLEQVQRSPQQTKLINRNRVDDFIFSVTEASTRVREEQIAKYPIQSELVRLADNLLSDLDIGSTRILKLDCNRSRYGRIRTFLNLMVEVWTWHLYADCKNNRPDVLDLSVFQAPARKRFNGIVESWE